MRLFKKIMIWIFTVLAILTIVAFIFVQQSSFGKIPTGKRLERIKKSSHYNEKEGVFKNLTETSLMSKEASYWKLIGSYFQKNNTSEPLEILPYMENDLKSTISGTPRITWFGHSTYLIQTNGKNIMVDPVFSERVSPVQYAGSKRYKGTENFSLNNLPDIDIIVISHDHYDHLDYGTISQLKDKDIKYYTPLGVGSHLEHWGVDPEKIREFDWWEGAEVNQDIKLIATPARHFSGRGLTNRNTTLWASFVLITKEYKIFLGGDSGYDTHFKTIGEKFGPFDLVILESGQYNNYWPNIHMMPEETVQAAHDLKGKVLLPVHWAKFTLALHSWDEPIIRLEKKAKEMNVKISTPMLGESIVLDSLYPDKKWWIRQQSND